MKRKLLALGITAILAGCGGSDSNDSAAPGGGGSTTEVTGYVEAPAGAVARFERDSIFEVALEFLIPSAAAAITGLEPVTGSTVELIRIDNTGAQVGDVLARTTTSTTGNYTLTVPAGVSLAGNLVVRITGTGTTQMRAQVVEQSVDISPVSEFVLQSFIDKGVDLATLETAAVIKLSGQVEEFDLAAGSDMSTMLAALEQEVGDFVDSSIDTIIAEPGDASGFAGDYRQIGFDWGMHDNDGGGYSGFEVGTWLSPMTFAAGATAGELTVSLSGEESADGLLLTSTGGTPSLRYGAELETFSASFPATVSDAGVIAVEIPFEEDIDGDYGWRSSPSVFRVQKALNQNVLFALSESALVRYGTTDTDNDGVTDAVDPDARSGDEVFRGLEFFVKKPSNATTGDLSGNFGRVYIGTTLVSSNFRAVESEQNILTFDGAGNLNSNAATRYTVERSADGSVNTLEEVAPEELGITYSVAADGAMNLGNGSLSDSFDFFALSDMESVDDALAGDEYVQEVRHSLTLGVKLPADIPTISGKVYRVLGVEAAFEGGGEVAVHTTRFASLITMTGQNSASLDGSLSDLILPSLGADLLVENETVADISLTVEVLTGGAATFSMADGDGTFTMQGFLNQDGSVGIMQTRYTPTGGQPNALGVAILIEVSQ